MQEKSREADVLGEAAVGIGWEFRLDSNQRRIAVGSERRPDRSWEVRAAAWPRCEEKKVMCRKRPCARATLSLNALCPLRPQSADRPTSYRVPFSQAQRCAPTAASRQVDASSCPLLPSFLPSTTTTSFPLPLFTLVASYQSEYGPHPRVQHHASSCPRLLPRGHTPVVSQCRRGKLRWLRLVRASIQ